MYNWCLKIPWANELDYPDSTLGPSQSSSSTQALSLNLAFYFSLQPCYIYFSSLPSALLCYSLTSLPFYFQTLTIFYSFIFQYSRFQSFISTSYTSQWEILKAIQAQYIQNMSLSLFLSGAYTLNPQTENLRIDTCHSLYPLCGKFPIILYSEVSF